jgi:hypothetical protein
MLKVPNYDRSLAGTWCITPHIWKKPLIPLRWSRVGDNMRKPYDNPYLTVENSGCFYKLIPHGKHLFTIQNNYDCPSNRYCGQYVSFNIIDGKARATIEDDDPTFWEIYGHQQKRYMAIEYNFTYSRDLIILRSDYMRVFISLNLISFKISSPMDSSDRSF